MARANASRPPPCRRLRGSARAARRLRGRLEEGGDVRVDLRDDELRDVEELREPVQRQVRPQRAVHVLGACGAGGGHVVDTPAGAGFSSHARAPGGSIGTMRPRLSFAIRVAGRMMPGSAHEAATAE